MNNSQFPVARKKDLVVQDMPDEILVYDLNSNKAHCLNQTAAMVWKSCDGNNSVSEIAKIIELQTGGSVSDDFVWLAIDQLGENDLLEHGIKPAFAGRSRREVIKKIGLAAVIGLPIVASMVAPSNVMALVSCGCVNPEDCLTQTSCPSTINCNGSGVCAP